MNRSAGLWTAIVAAAVMFALSGAALHADDGPAAAAPQSLSPKTIRLTLGSYNIENFFDRHDDPYNGDEVMQPKEEAALAKAAEVIAATGADFMGIVEMENMGALSEFVEKRLPDSGYKYVYVNQTLNLRGINNGFVSRIRPYSMTVYRFNELKLPGDTKSAWPFARDLLQVELRPGDGKGGYTPLTVFVVHLKSKRDGPGDKDSNKWRTAEILALRKIISDRLAANPDDLIAVVGDFNDTPESAPIAVLTGDAEHPAVLVDCTTSIPADDRITYLRNPYRSQIDYVMASPALAKCLVPGSAKVVYIKGMMEGSDHAPIEAAFDIPVRKLGTPQ